MLSRVTPSLSIPRRRYHHRRPSGILSIGPRQTRILEALNTYGRMTIAEAAGATGILTSSARPLVSHLLRLKLIAPERGIMRQGPTRRERLYALTADGVRFIAAWRTFLAEVGPRVVRHLGIVGQRGGRA
jgi:DNA-binding MarR family transcriptional regulator